MCGITGFLQYGGGNAEWMRVTVEAMAACLRHRGPDDDGLFVDTESGVALGFRRLSIVDLTAAGAQPMTSASGRYTIIYNGEVYNAERIRPDLPPQPWRGHSDTEVMLAAIEAWGLRGALDRFIGMFALALWDRETRTLTIVRDRAGVKPMYYAATPRALVFGSEIKAILGGLKAAPTDVDREALALYARFGYIPAPSSIYSAVRKLRPGAMLSVNPTGDIREETWWDPRAIAESTDRFRGDDREALDEAERLLADSVKLRMVADVPLGVFLSGGIDSSLVTALMQKQETNPVRTFTIGFEEALFDEARFGAAVAAHLGTAHTAAYVRSHDVLETIPLLPRIYDEPLADTSAIPTYLVSRLARRSVTVALSGDGGDELFGGYHRYFLGARMYRRAGRVPRLLRRPMAAALSRLSNPRARRYAVALRDGTRGSHLRDLDYTEPITAAGCVDPPFVLLSEESWPRLRHPVEMQMWLDFVTYLVDDILAKVDRASMAVSLEAREPLLDHRLVRFAWSLPLSMKVRDDQGKWLLRTILKRYLPSDLVDRDKQGFGLPVARWLRSDLREWCEDLLREETLRDYWDVARVRRLWAEHVAGEDRAAVLWRVLMFEAWRSEQRAASSE